MTGEVTLAILAGGRGRRLGGVPKGLLRVEGRTLLARLLELAPHFFEALLVADDPSPYSAYPVRAVPDLHASRGAPGGLHAALSAARTPWLLLVACDMPFVTLDCARYLFARRPAVGDFACVARDGRLEPMPGLYHRRLLRLLEQRLPEEPSLQRLLNEAAGETISASEWERVDPGQRALVSLNSPGDLARFGAQLPP